MLKSNECASSQFVNITSFFYFSMNRDQAIKRIKMYKEHFRPTKDFYREVDGCTFNFELAAKVVHGIRPEQHYKAIE